MNSKNTYLITQPIFGVKKNDIGKKLVSHSSIINYGEDLGDGTIKYLTRDGEQTSSVFTFDSSISLIKFDSICLDNLMSKWKRLNKENKPIVLDESIETNEVYVSDFSPMNIMIERRADCIAIKPIF